MPWPPDSGLRFPTRRRRETRLCDIVFADIPSRRSLRLAPADSGSLAYSTADTFTEGGVDGALPPSAVDIPGTPFPRLRSILPYSIGSILSALSESVLGSIWVDFEDQQCGSPKQRASKAPGKVNVRCEQGGQLEGALYLCSESTRWAHACSLLSCARRTNSPILDDCMYEYKSIRVCTHDVVSRILIVAGMGRY